MRVAYVQMSCVFGQVEANRQKAAEMIRGHDADLFVLPELFSSGYLFAAHDEVAELSEDIPAGPTSQFLAALATEKGCRIVAGLPERSGNHYFISAALVGPGDVLATYRKTHLFSDEKKWFTPGDTGFGVFEVDRVRLGIMICFDWIFPEVTRTLALKGADVICHPSNLVLPYCQRSMPTRALENGVFIITANRIGTEKRNDTELTFTGGSQIVDPRGNVLSKAEPDKEAVGIVTIDLKQARDKAITQTNDLLGDRRPELYEPGTRALDV